MSAVPWDGVLLLALVLAGTAVLVLVVTREDV